MVRFVFRALDLERYGGIQCAVESFAHVESRRGARVCLHARACVCGVCVHAIAIAQIGVKLSVKLRLRHGRAWGGVSECRTRPRVCKWMVQGGALLVDAGAQRPKILTDVLR